MASRDQNAGRTSALRLEQKYTPQPYSSEVHNDPGGQDLAAEDVLDVHNCARG